MIEAKKALIIASSWISVVYAVCFAGVAIFPGIRPWFMEYALHTRINTGEDILTLTAFATGLVIWNIVAILAVWLFVALNNYFAR